MKSDHERVESVSSDGKRGIKSYVLRSSALKPSQKEALSLYKDQYVIPFDPSERLDFSNLFQNNNKTVIEIGFGMGYSTLSIATKFPHLNFIGIEVFYNGFAKLLHNVGKSGLANLKLIRFDAVEVLEKMIRDESVYGFHIFFPDPWPKKKHHKRRLIQDPFVSLLASKLENHGYIYSVTDWQEYADQIVDTLMANRELINPYRRFAPPQKWRPTTSFERKGVDKNHPINEVWVEKRQG